MLKKLMHTGVVLALLALAALAAGCSRDKGPVSKGEPQAGKHEDLDHGHAEGIKAMGDYHARILLEQEGQLRLFILGKDETKVARIETQEIKAHVRAAGAADAVSVVLKPEPQPGDPAGQTSQFVATLPEALRGKPLVVTARLTIAGEAYQPEFQTAAAAHDDHVAVPKGLTAALPDEIKQLYLTPGGKYTESDIQANGRVTAHEKYQGTKAAHDMKPKSGDRICPITQSKANARFTWVVDGKTYEFCCPPCIDEFVQTAKANPDEIKPPAEYVKK
jgi:YHS domain-containing protein